MKKNIRIIMFLIAFIFSSCNLKKTDTILTIDDAVFDSTEKRVAIIHPSIDNIEHIAYLLENKIIDVNNMNFIGIYNSYENYDYTKSQKFIEKNNYSFIKLYQIDDELNRNNLYEQNESTSEFTKIFKNTIGVIFFGGDDLPPNAYNSKTNLLNVTTDYDRHYFELSFLFHLLGGYQDSSFTPLLETNNTYFFNGFCLGMQTMNVATGGTMYQDIPSELYGIQYVEDVLKLDKNKQHRNYWGQIYSERDVSWINFHRIKFSQKKLFVSDTNFEPNVLSAHHQCVKSLGKGLQIFATSLDKKIPEAIYHKKYSNVFAVQFHPEQHFLYSYDEQFKLTPNDAKKISCRKILEKDGSYEFHLDYWKYFNSIVKN
ncbi:MAG: gamma-glutamyl-gamma-aminobutyrate hydrolase family protein [Candidatus Marinimicrobia bacterium]|nr:gamma-glutamyl-gamma-aminobutyrate hydrolase family protein [Candidatus Neomarinimicrobiota bacterium]